MKTNLLVAAALCVFAIGMTDAQATTGANCMNLSSCVVTLNGDAGANLKRCDGDSGASCTCTEYALSMPVPCPTGRIGTATSCPSGYSYTGANTMLGARCCYKNITGTCPNNQEAQLAAEDITVQTSSEDSESLAELYSDNDANILTGELYFGYAGTTLRSPNTGRSNAYHAKLDACLFYTDVDTIVGNTTYDKWNSCRGAGGACETTAKNEYCRANSTNDGATVLAGVCKDRCDCFFGNGTYGTCENN